MGRLVLSDRGHHRKVHSAVPVNVHDDFQRRILAQQGLDGLARLHVGTAVARCIVESRVVNYGDAVPFTQRRREPLSYPHDAGVDRAEAVILMGVGRREVVPAVHFGGMGVENGDERPIAPGRVA